MRAISTLLCCAALAAPLPSALAAGETAPPPRPVASQSPELATAPRPAPVPRPVPAAEVAPAADDAAGDEAEGALAAGDEGARESDEAATVPLDADAIGAKLALWQFMRQGGRRDADAYAAALSGMSHWPGAEVVQRHGEQRLQDESAQRVIDWFAEREPITLSGRLALLRALERTGQMDAARELAREIWRDSPLNARDEAAVLALHAADLADLHVERLDNLLWAGASGSAERMLQRVSAGHAAVGRARIALQARARGVNELIARVPEDYVNHPGLAHDRFAWRLHHQNFDSAGDLLIEQSARDEGLGRPQAWAAGRQRLVRRALTAGQHQRAYDLATPNWLDGGAVFADVEWLAGFIALRHLDDPEAAAQHFATLRSNVGAPISLARAGYWEGLAREAMGDEDGAQTALAFAAEHQTAFYGLLAAEKLGLPLDAALVEPPSYPDWTETSLAQSDVLQAAKLLHETGDWHEARRFVLHLARNLEDENELGALADLWLDRGEPNFAVNIAKIAIGSGIVLPRAYFPLTGLEEADLPAPSDLVMAIARRESEFDPAVVSPADARGLLQVLPGTGELVARRLGVPFSAGRLTTDPEFNALLGAAYLDGLISEFGAFPLVAAGYNAGPGRPRRWVREFGDPRDPSVDPVDWVETIPFAETRNYVMRVAESLIIYRAMLNGEREIRMTELLRGN